MASPRLNLTTLAVYAAGLAAIYIWSRGVKGTASDVVEVVVSTAEGTVIGIGKVVGIPETDAQKCEDFVNAGEWLDASFYCPAGTFLKSAAGAVIDAATGETVGYTEAGAPAIIELEYEASP